MYAAVGSAQLASRVYAADIASFSNLLHSKRFANFQIAFIFLLSLFTWVAEQIFHTQEKRTRRLTQPVPCKRDDAWLGEGYYFWHDISDAHQWGNKSKKRTGHYEIYRGEADFSHILDTVFNKTHYFWWLEQIEYAANEIRKKSSSGRKPTLKQLNDFFKRDPEWKKIEGMLFQDLPDNFDSSLIEPVKTSKGKKRVFAYKKRIQLVLYTLNALKNFEFLAENQCLQYAGSE